LKIEMQPQHAERFLQLAEHPLFGFESSLPYNTGIIFSGGMPSTETERTLVITGTPRGGTTAIAECIATLGVPMGVSVPPRPEQFNYEDPAFTRILHMEPPEDLDLESLRELVRQRNEEYSTWGFKLPMALRSLPALERELRNPMFLFVFRDLVAVSSREVIANGDNAISAMVRALEWQQKMLDFIASSIAPCLLISYEKALQFPDLLARILARWSGLPCAESFLKDASGKIAANRDHYLRGVRLQCDHFGIPIPPKA
jgi:hypothetical protein